VFQPEIGSFCLHLAAEGKAVKTVRTYTDAVAWFAAAHLIPCTSPDQAGAGGWARCAEVAGLSAGQRGASRPWHKIDKRVGLRPPTSRSPGVGPR
jgi:hypothetical protein